MNIKYRLIAYVFAALMAFTMVFNAISLFGLGTYDMREGIITLVFNAIVLFVFVVSAIDIRFARYCQPGALIFSGYLSFIMDGFDIFFVWGLFLVGLLLGYEYGIWNKNTRIKVFSIVISYISVAIVSGVVSGALISTFLSSCVFMSFIVFFAVVIYRNQIESFLKLRQDYRKLADELVNKQNVLLDLEEQLENAETELQRHETVLSMEESITAITADLNVLEDRIGNIHGFTHLTDLDLKMLVRFYVARGNKTNKELAFDIGKDENYVKNHLRSIYNSIPEINSRAALLAYISVHLE